MKRRPKPFVKGLTIYPLPQPVQDGHSQWSFIQTGHVGALGQSQPPLVLSKLHESSSKSRGHSRPITATVDLIQTTYIIVQTGYIPLQTGYVITQYRICNWIGPSKSPNWIINCLNRIPTYQKWRSAYPNWISGYSSRKYGYPSRITGYPDWITSFPKMHVTSSIIAHIRVSFPIIAHSASEIGYGRGNPVLTNFLSHDLFSTRLGNVAA
jgi:hypothetical protein